MTHPHLQSGEYLIKNKHSEKVVGRRRPDDPRSGPKGIVVEPYPYPWPNAKWRLKRLENGNYELQAWGDPVFVFDKLVYAHTSRLDNTEWKITYREGSAGHTIMKVSGTGGWVLPNDRTDTQVAFRPLTASTSHSPRYPSNEIWILEPNREQWYTDDT
ncbi:hypothetical protein D9615_007513 [Tricholomella constricta]|uniref:Uncharacterized protein n=1 Tax=Tricholomella constricta TaxID=117010 RepID=A0A8H5H7H7_9AGAR|nr:hypothetical protein D9615_007513 [Tricholomella constricta]